MTVLTVELSMVHSDRHQLNGQQLNQQSAAINEQHNVSLVAISYFLISNLVWLSVLVPQCSAQYSYVTSR